MKLIQKLARDQKIYLDKASSDIHSPERDYSQGRAEALSMVVLELLNGLKK